MRERRERGLTVEGVKGQVLVGGGVLLEVHADGGPRDSGAGKAEDEARACREE